jgi:hypothetical protein
MATEPMIPTIKELQVQYVTNETGRTEAVILPIKEFEELLDDIEDLDVLAEKCDEPTITHDELVAKLKRNGLL